VRPTGTTKPLLARYRTEGDTAFEPRSRRPNTRPDATPAATVALVTELRRQLTADGLDAGADTIMRHLEHHHHITISRATVYRILRRANLIWPEPAKKPRSSYIRFQAEQPNETWQADFTHWRLANGVDIEILTWLDEHSRYALPITAHRPVTGPVVVATFPKTSRYTVEHHTAKKEIDHVETGQDDNTNQGDDDEYISGLDTLNSDDALGLNGTLLDVANEAAANNWDQATETKVRNLANQLQRMPTDDEIMNVVNE
jgi:transposase